MSKKKYSAPNNTISEYIFNDYLCDSDLGTNDMLQDKIDILISNNLAYKISGVEYFIMKCDVLYRLASKFIQKYNKFNRNYRREILDYEFGGKRSRFENAGSEFVELAKYALCEGVYYCQMDDDNYAKLVSKIIDDDGTSRVSFDFYLIGKNWKKWKDIFYDMVRQYSDLSESSREEFIVYTDGRQSVNAIFKPFSQVIIKDKDNLIRYIDNFISNIPVYYNKYHMISKLSILLYGKPGTGKSTVARAIAKHLGITNVTSLGPTYFDSMDKGSSNKRGSYRRYDETVYSIDDIDCICKSREESDDKENAEMLSALLSFLDNPPTFYYKAKDGTTYPISIVIATTNYYDKLDDAVKRYGRFDLKIEMNEFDKDQAQEMCDLYDLKLNDLVKDTDRRDFTISPSYLQALCLENVDKALKKVD